MLFIITFLLTIQFGVFSNEINDNSIELDSFYSESISDSSYDDSESEYFESSSDNIIETCSSISSSSSEEEENGMNINTIFLLIFVSVAFVFVFVAMIYVVIESIYKHFEKKGKPIFCNCSSCLRKKNKDDDEILTQMITA